MFRNSEDGHLLTLFKVAEIPFLNVKLKLDGMNQEGGLAILLPKTFRRHLNLLTGCSRERKKEKIGAKNYKAAAAGHLKLQSFLLGE